MDHQIEIKSCWTNARPKELKTDYFYLANTVFGTFVTEDYYKAKYENNIYGPSLLTVAYVDGYPAGADVMWRNDVKGKKAYQTVDTCVLEPFRGMGLFKKITCHELDFLGYETLVYGFPNVNSYPGYIKMGWHEQRFYKTFCRPRDGEALDVSYAAWWMKAQTGITHIRKKGTYYLIRKQGNKHTAILIGQVDEKTARLFPEAKGVWLLKRFDTTPSIYNRSKSIPLVCNKPNEGIPYWKIDAI